MSQYTPVGNYADAVNGKDTQGGERERYHLYRKVTKEEYDAVVDYAIDIGIENCMIQEGDVADDSFIPAFDGSGI